MTRDEELILEKQKPHIRHANVDLFDVMPVPERKIKTSGLKKKKGIFQQRIHEKLTKN